MALINPHPPNMPPLQIFAQETLLPRAWATYPLAQCYFFNPAITRFGDRLIMSYRVVTPDGQRRLALCRLTADFAVVPESLVPLSDFMQTGGDWHADARFCAFQDRLFIHYNDGSQRGRSANHLYWVEIDPERLTPLREPQELVLDGPRRAVEKNWMFFAHDGALWAIYSIAPHIVLSVTLAESGPIHCRPVYTQSWDVTAYTARYGQLRGGAPPVRVGDHYVTFCHSAFVAHPWRRRFFRLLRKAPTNITHYVGGVYGFAAEPPFAPLWLCATPPIFPPHLPRHRPQLNPVVDYSAYPCGALLQDGQWIVSFGARNEYCCLARLPATAMTSAPLISSAGGATQDGLYDTPGRPET